MHLYWYGGAYDAARNLTSYYHSALSGMVTQLKTDLELQDVFLTMARLNDWRGVRDEDWLIENWCLTRQAQGLVGNTDAGASWFSTDDMNGDKNDELETVDGLEELVR